ncbi:hypothetical protein HHX47_DHR3001159 [Lentinula edodes]|nr:hypothetical protein HHX47_DHR3001159 [Lentinula edodes]
MGRLKPTREGNSIVKLAATLQRAAKLANPAPLIKLPRHRSQSILVTRPILCPTSAKNDPTQGNDCSTCAEYTHHLCSDLENVTGPGYSLAKALGNLNSKWNGENTGCHQVESRAHSDAAIAAVKQLHKLSLEHKDAQIRGLQEDHANNEVEEKSTLEEEEKSTKSTEVSGTMGHLDERRTQW